MKKKNRNRWTPWNGSSALGFRVQRCCGVQCLSRRHVRAGTCRSFISCPAGWYTRIARLGSECRQVVCPLSFFFASHTCKISCAEVVGVLSCSSCLGLLETVVGRILFQQRMVTAVDALALQDHACFNVCIRCMYPPLLYFASPLTPTINFRLFTTVRSTHGPLPQGVFKRPRSEAKEDGGVPL